MQNPVRPILYAVDGEMAGDSAQGGADGLAAGGDSAEMSAEDLVEIAYGSDGNQQGEALGERIPKNVRRPNASTQAMLDEHYPSHAHYRSWCPDCVAGRSVGKQHKTPVSTEEPLGVTISLDYAFWNAQEEEQDLSPILVAYDHGKRALWVLEVYKKGVEAGVGVKWLAAKLEFAGYTGVKVTLRSDQEVSILALKRAVAVKRAAETAFVESPVRESKSNGKIERAVRTWRDQYRTLRHQFERKMNVKLEKSGVLSSWLVSWAAEVLNRYKLQESGRTAFEMLTGHRCKTAVVGFGEKVFFQHTSRQKDDYKKEVGIFLGITDRSSSYLVGTREGIYSSAHIMALPSNESYDSTMIQEILVRHYDFIKDGVLPPPAVVAARVIPATPHVAPDPVVPVGGGYAPRRARITREELAEHGYTEGCPACASAAVGGSRNGAHSEACRQRMEALMSGDKLERVKSRMNQFGVENTSAKQSGEAAEVVMGEAEVELQDAEGHRSEARVVASPPHIRIDTPVLESAPAGPTDARFRTPERAPPTKRSGGGEMVEGTRRRLNVDEAMGEQDDDSPVLYSPSSPATMNDGADGMLSPSAADPGYSPGTAAWLGDDTEMSSLSELDRKILASVILGVDITEVFSPARVNQLATKFGLVPGNSLDLTDGWDFEIPAHRQKAWQLVKETAPFVVIGSPPCTMFSNLQQLNLHIHRNDPAWLRNFEEQKAKARGHIDFCIMLYRYQLKMGRHFVHEHPWGADSWKLPNVMQLLSDPRVIAVKTDMCRFGMTSHIQSKNGERGLVRKPTGFMTSSECIAAELERKCLGDHSHVHLEGGRASAAQVYPPELCEAMLRGVVRQKKLDSGRRVSLLKMKPDEVSRFIGHIGGPKLGTIFDNGGVGKPAGSWPAHWIDPVHEEDGGNDKYGASPQRGIEVLRSELDALNFRGGIAHASDDVSGKELVPELVQVARSEEMAYFKKLGVYEVVPKSQQATLGGKVIGTRWVDTNKGDVESPDYRSRLVGREFNVGKDDTLYASTPPLEALRYVVSRAATWGGDGSNRWRRAIMINDVRRAYFYAKASRDLYIDLPAEDPAAGTGMLGKLKLCLYGTRDAAKSWQETLSAQLVDCGFKRGVGHPSVFVHTSRDIITLVHGDDYVSAGSDVDLEWLRVQLEAAYDIKTQLLGLRPGYERQGKVLNRLIHCNDSGWRLEADPRHAELVVEQLGVGDCRSVATPGIDGSEEVDHDDDVDIVGDDATRFRGVAARCNYLAFDRPDMQFATKEICREMSKPTTGSLRRLQRLGRYLKGRPRLVWHFDMQEPPSTLDVYTDSDWAGCRKSRKSTSGGTVMLGTHCLKTWSKTQALVAKSSGEAELYGVVRGATESLGMSTLIKDFGSDIRIQMHLDASAAKGIVERMGISKLRHIDVNVLWLQETTARKIVPLAKIPGELNTADLTTKHLTSALIDKNISRMSMSFEGGRAEKAANLHSMRVKLDADVGSDGAIDKLLSSIHLVDGQRAWKDIRAAANDERGGDRWKSRGSGGTWHRWHTTPRLALFTPYKVAKGPSKDISMNHQRFTCGVTKSGKSFEFFDDWTRPDSSHRTLEEPWIGYTVFLERGHGHAEFQDRRSGAHLQARPGERWADIV